MSKPRGREHTTLTESAEIFVHELKKYPGIKMIAPGIIDAKRSGKRHLTAVYTTAGIHFIVSGTGVQKIAVHLVNPEDGRRLVSELRNAKALKQFAWGERKTYL
ncbi:MAG: hypothetical protein MUF19_02085 [Candidatus Pacebacteria bacterium]|jgi:hypothetical protein|nr:hypothetical protein [Candidatus Paceibacterota bacterium]